MNSPDFTPLWPQVEKVILARQPAGFHGPRRTGDWLTFHSPLREDRHPSFSVKPDSDADPGAFKDHARDVAGSMAELARLLDIDPRISNGHTSNGHAPRS